jgi:hypothetical protein
MLDFRWSKINSFLTSSDQADRKRHVPACFFSRCPVELVASMPGDHLAAAAEIWHRPAFMRMNSMRVVIVRGWPPIT